MVLFKVAKLFADSGSVSLCAFVSPYKKDRELARRLHQEVWPLLLSRVLLYFHPGWITLSGGFCRHTLGGV